MRTEIIASRIQSGYKLRRSEIQAEINVRIRAARFKSVRTITRKIEIRIAAVVLKIGRAGFAGRAVDVAAEM